MNISVKPGKYVLAVSGGVDSMVLMHVLAHQPGLSLVVAHFEHGIREDSDNDRQFVAVAAETLGLSFIYVHGNLGVTASEASAREARYAFLEKVREEQGAEAIITAHHQDDLLETALINVLRGTGRKGLTALADNPKVVRPLLHIAKENVLQYAREQRIAWREDSTNAEDTYLRNYLRHNVIVKLTAAQRQRLLTHIADQQILNTEIDQLLTANLVSHEPVSRELKRSWFISLPYDVAAETMAAWLRSHDVRTFDRGAIARLVVAAKTAQAGKVIDIQSGHRLQIERGTMRLLNTPGS